MFRKALELHPTYVEGHFNLGWSSNVSTIIHSYIALLLLVMHLEIISLCGFSGRVQVETILCRLRIFSVI